MAEHKRYLAFAGSSYYADGGWLDFVGYAATKEEAVAIAKAKCAEIDSYGGWWHVVDIEAKRIVVGLDGSYCGGLSDDIPEG
jgi:hypothetical protein